MNLKNYSVQKLKSELLYIVQKHSEDINFRLFFFGSRVRKEEADDRADIDVGYEGANKLSIRTLRKIKEEIEDIRTIYKIDFVDSNRTSSSFKEEAKQYLEIIQ